MAPEFDLQAAINNVMSQLGSINSDTSSKASGSSESAYINSVWGLVQDGQGVAQGNDERKAKAITNILVLMPEDKYIRVYQIISILTRERESIYSVITF